MLEIIKLFVRRMLMGKGKGILQVAPKKNVDDFAKDLYKKFKDNGVPDGAVKNPKDVKVIWNQITNKEAQIFSTRLEEVVRPPVPGLPKKSAEVIPFQYKKTFKQEIEEMGKKREPAPTVGGKTIEEVLGGKSWADRRKIEKMTPGDVIPKETLLTKDKSFRIKQGLSTKIKLNTLGENKQFAKELVTGKNSEFNTLDKAAKREVLDRLEINIKNAKADFATPVKPEDLASGGIAGQLHLNRPGFEKGKKVDLSKRKFMKGAGAGLGVLSMLPFVGKFFKPAAKAVSKAAKVTKFPDGEPSYLADLIAVVKAKGKSSVGGYQDTISVHRYKNVEVIEDAAGGTKIKHEKQFDIGQDHPGYRENQMELTKVDEVVEPESGQSFYRKEGMGDELHSYDELETLKGNNAKLYDEGTLRPDPNDPGKFMDDLDAIREADHLELKEIADEAKDLMIKKASGGRVPFIFGGSAGLKALWKSVVKNISKGRDKPIKKLFPSLSAEEKRLEKLVTGSSEQKAFREGEVAHKIEGLDIMINRLKHDKKILARQAENKAMKDEGLDFIMKKMEESMSDVYGHLGKYTDIDKDILQLENIKKNLLMKGRKPNASGGIAGQLHMNRQGYEGGKIVEGKGIYEPPQNKYGIGLTSILEDVMRDAPKKGTWNEKDLEYIWDIMQGEHDIENIEDELMLRFGRMNPEKKSKFFAEIGKGKVGFGWKKQFASGGLAGQLHMNQGGAAWPAGRERFLKEEIDDDFWIDHYSKVLNIHLDTLESKKEGGRELTEDEESYARKQSKELKKHGGDATEFDSRIGNLFIRGIDVAGGGRVSGGLSHILGV